MTDPTSRLTATLADRYRIEREIGEGGMAKVYLAHDVRHDRKVAVKVLRPELAAVIGPERFLAEIKTTAHLQHPHILGLIDSGEAAGFVFYVMPFVQGESLKERIEREQQLPVNEAVRIATQVASALDYAHRHGVIHRDIKPANILLHDQQALVADFGIALAASKPGDKKRMTDTGMSLGTPHYMSPEQAMGERTLDARTDIYALGCVLYEMLTGEPPFDGPSAQAIIAKVMSSEPEPVTTVRKTVPHNVAAATMMALSKLPADRFPDAAAFAAALENVQFSGPRTTAAIVPTGTMVVRKSHAVAAVAALAAMLAAFIAILSRTPAEVASRVGRFEIAVEAGTANQVHLRPDGSALIWSSGGALWERPLDSLGNRKLRDLTSLQGTIRDISPSGTELLLAGRGGISVVPIGGGPARELASSGEGRGGSAWSRDDYVYFTFGSGGPEGIRGVARVKPQGGQIDTVGLFPEGRGVANLVPLPGGRAVLATIGTQTAESIVVLDTRSKKWTTLGPGGRFLRYVEPGYVLFASGQYIMAAPFDRSSLELGEPLPFIEMPGGVSAIATAANVLVYRSAPDPQGGAGMEVRSASGASRLLPGIPSTVSFAGFTLSPDGRRIAASGFVVPTSGGITQVVSNVYVYELPSGPLQPFQSSEPETSPAWMPGSRDISFLRYDDSTNAATLLRRAWDGSASATVIAKRPAPVTFVGAAAWLPGAGRAIVQIGNPFGGRGGRGARGGRGPGRGSGGPPDGPPPNRGGEQAPGDRGGGSGGGRGPINDLMWLNTATPDALSAFVASEFSEQNPVVSPDGRLVAYTSNSSGRTEVYVSPIDGSARRVVSRNGGSMPKWSHSGRELFFRAASAGQDTLLAARIERAPELAVGEIRVALTGANLGSGYTPLPGDTTFVARPVAAEERRPFIVVLNFEQELAKLFARK